MTKKNLSPYALTLPPAKAHSLVELWLKLAVGALAIAGFFAILLVFARTPYFQNHIPLINFFHTALIVHVDLSVLVWMMALTGLMWHFTTYDLFPTFGRTAAWLCIAGTVLIALSAFNKDAQPLLNNYIPVLQNITFFAGLSLFSCGIIFACALVLLAFQKELSKGIDLKNPLRLGILLNGIIIAVALICFVLSYQSVIQPEVFSVVDAQQFYELAFWGGGHTLQFTYTLALMMAWLWMAQELKFRLLPSPTSASWLFIIHAACASASLLAYRYEVLSFEYSDFFTQQMRFGLGFAPVIIMLFMIAGLIQTRSSKVHKHLFNTLLWSVILFAMGGFIGFLIHGSNVIIPAHYHGSIVGTTLALMGLVYLLLDRLGYTHLPHKLARLQPIIYGSGQLMHVLGFAISGGYGTLRKTPGAAQTPEGQAALGLMGLGGLLSLIGGLVFVVVVYKIMSKGRTHHKKKS